MISRQAEISYATVIARAKMELGIENTTDYDPYLLLKADEAMRQINDLSMFEFRTETVPMDSGTAPLPCGLVRIVAIWFTDSNGNRSSPIRKSTSKDSPIRYFGLRTRERWEGTSMRG
jgi:hypothetical protein